MNNRIYPLDEMPSFKDEFIGFLKNNKVFIFSFIVFLIIILITFTYFRDNLYVLGAILLSSSVVYMFILSKVKE